MSARDTLRFDGATAVITGGASGIGLAIARALAERGTNLALLDMDGKGLAAAQAELSNRCRVMAVECNVSNDADVASAAARVDAGLGPVHLLFNNAGIDVSGRLDELTLSEWQRGFGVNVFGVVHCLRHFRPLLQKHGQRAHIVNTASGAGLWVNTLVPMGAYAATKYAVVAISEALEQELAGTPVGVSVLCPGPVATPIAQRSPGASAQLRASIAAGTAPAAAAEMTLDAMQRDEFFIFTPTRMAAALEQRHARIMAALANVRPAG